MARHNGPGEAETRIPAPAAALVDLLNSRPHATPPLPDTLGDPATAIEILSRFGQPAGVPPSPEQVDQIRALRSDLIAVVTASDSDEVTRGWTEFTAHASTVLFQQAFDATGRAYLRQVVGDPIVGRIVLTITELVAANIWTRIRACANDYCAHVFYDTTRSRTQRWHSYEICGNRVNVATFRARKKQPRTTG